MDTMNLSDFSGFGLESVKEDTVANLTAIDEDSDEAPSSSMDLLKEMQPGHEDIYDEETL